MGRTLFSTGTGGGEFTHKSGVGPGRSFRGFDGEAILGVHPPANQFPGGISGCVYAGRRAVKFATYGRDDLGASKSGEKSGSGAS